MKKLITTIGFLLAGTSFGAEWRQLCYTDTGMCIHYRTYHGERFGEIVIKDTDAGLVTPEIKAELKEIGFSLSVYPTSLYDSYALKWPLVYKSLAEDKAALNDPALKTVVKSGASCAGGLAACAGSSYVALETAGGSLFMARLACARAGGSCAAFIIDYRDWKKFQVEIKAKAAADAASKNAHSGGGEPSNIQKQERILVPVGSPYAHKRHGYITIEDEHPYNP